MSGTFVDTAQAALDAATGLPASPDDPPSPIPPGDPPVIRRLPRSVDYTHIKMIILSLPAPLTTLVWRGDPTADPLWGAFNRKSLRAIDRQLRRREATLGAHGPAVPATEGAFLQGLRQQWVLLCLREMNERASHERLRWIRVRRVDPTRFPPEFRPPGPPQLHDVIEVWKAGRRGPALIDQRTLLPTVPPWGDPKVPWFDPDEYHRACAELLRHHFADVLSRRCGRRWRSKYPPPGWPSPRSRSLRSSSFSAPTMWCARIRTIASRGWPATTRRNCAATSPRFCNWSCRSSRRTSRSPG